VARFDLVSCPICSAELMDGTLLHHLQVVHEARSRPASPGSSPLTCRFCGAGPDELWTPRGSPKTMCAACGQWSGTPHTAGSENAPIQVSGDTLQAFFGWLFIGLLLVAVALFSCVTGC